MEDTLLTLANKEVGLNYILPSLNLKKCVDYGRKKLVAKQQINLDECKTSSPEQRYPNLLQKT